MIRFAEHMEGYVETPEQRLPFVFDVEATGPSLAAPFQLSGTVRLGGDDPAQVTSLQRSACRLEIGVPWRRYLRYSLGWTAGGKQYRFFGEKNLRLLRFFHTISTLHGYLYCDGDEVGRAVLQFRWRTLPRFLASWRLESSTSASAAVSAEPHRSHGSLAAPAA